MNNFSAITSGFSSASKILLIERKIGFTLNYLKSREQFYRKQSEAIDSTIAQFLAKERCFIILGSDLVPDTLLGLCCQGSVLASHFVYNVSNVKAKRASEAVRGQSWGQNRQDASRSACLRGEHPQRRQGEGRREVLQGLRKNPGGSHQEWLRLRRVWRLQVRLSLS